MAAPIALAAISEAKLKLLDSALEKFADVAKNSGALNDMFNSMKEGSMMMAPWNIFLDLLSAETTKASVDSLKELLNVITDPNTKNAISELGKAFGEVVSGGLDFIKFFVDYENSLNNTAAAFGRISAEMSDYARDIGIGIKGTIDEIGKGFNKLFASAREWTVVGEEFNKFFEDATAGIGRRTQAEYGR